MSSLETPVRAADEWKAQWPLVLAAMVGFSFHSIATYSSGLFIEPLQEEFGWSRGQITAGLAIAAISTVPLSPFVGAIIDRWGSRRIALPGLVLTACSLASFGTTGASIAYWLGLWCIYALVGLSVKSTVWTFAVSQAFSAGRGLALAVMLSGTAIAQSLVPPLAQWLIATVGWREAWFWLGFGWCLPALVLAWFFLKDAKPATRPPHAASGPHADVALRVPGMTMGEALRNPALLKLGGATFIMMTLGLAVIVHQVPILTEIGMSREVAAWLAGLSGVAGIVGKLVTGALMDRFDGARIGALTIGVSAAGFALLLAPPSLPTIITGIVIIGYAVGTKLQVAAYLTSQITGMNSFGKIFGMMNSLIALGAGLGPVMSGFIYDAFGTYAPLLLAGIPGSLISAFLVYSLRGSRTPPPAVVEAVSAQMEP
ncbi:MFS transporter [Novosphingobium endophyticum]|uniref:MFS transporter n=1 Tax=Novosphingobium endophyticum TaxID=1955250 RepID=A0A916X443_9SPHN|nr:MFS transporter [Novosphingobium endophyticum]GGB85804.1 MFS transporter [Novosphingobium endophyticum]